jgi:hypothetical protein
MKPAASDCLRPLALSRNSHSAGLRSRRTDFKLKMLWQNYADWKRISNGLTLIANSLQTPENEYPLKSWPKPASWMGKICVKNRGTKAENSV